MIFLQLRRLKNEDRQLPFMAKLKQMDFLGAILLIAAILFVASIAMGRGNIPLAIINGHRLVHWRWIASGCLQSTAIKSQEYSDNGLFFIGSFYIFFLNMSNFIVSQRHATHKDSIGLATKHREGRILSTVLLPSGSGYSTHKKWYTICFSGLS